MFFNSNWKNDEKYIKTNSPTFRKTKDILKISMFFQVDPSVIRNEYSVEYCHHF